MLELKCFALLKIAGDFFWKHSSMQYCNQYYSTYINHYSFEGYSSMSLPIVCAISSLTFTQPDDAKEKEKRG